MPPATSLITVRTESGQILVLDERIGRGGEALVYRVRGEPGIVAKLYHAQRLEDPERRADRERKIQVMCANPPDDDARRMTPPHTSIAWPQHTLYLKGEFCGFTMPYIANATPVIDLLNPRAREKISGFSWASAHQLARNITTAVGALHRRGYVIGDVNQQNFLVNDQGLVTLVDTDSFQVRDVPDTIPTVGEKDQVAFRAGRIFRCPVGKPEYTPPELQGKSLGEVDRTIPHDLFGVAVLLFQLLMEGRHPFSGVPINETHSIQRVDLHCIRAGIFPYNPRPNAEFEPPPGSIRFEELNHRLRTLFLRAFEDGHWDPTLRPSLDEWRVGLEGAIRDLTVCPRNRLHTYDHEQPACPWCAREATNRAMQQPMDFAFSKRHLPLRFGDGREVQELHELVDVIDDRWVDGRDMLYRDVFTGWLAARGETQLAQMAQDITTMVRDDRDVGLEMFLQQLGGVTGITRQSPEIAASQTEIDFGTVRAGSEQQQKVMLINRSRVGEIRVLLSNRDSDWLTCEPTLLTLRPGQPAACTVTATPKAGGSTVRTGQIRIEADPRWGVPPLAIPVRAKLAFDAGGLLTRTVLGAGVGAVIGFGLALLPLLWLGAALAAVLAVAFGGLIWWMRTAGYVQIRRVRRSGVNVLAGLMAGAIPIALALTRIGPAAPLLDVSLREYLATFVGGDLLSWLVAFLPGALVGGTWGLLYSATRERAGYVTAAFGTAAMVLVIGSGLFGLTAPRFASATPAAAVTPQSGGQPTRAALTTTGAASTPLPAATAVAGDVRRVRNEVVNLRAQPGADGSLLLQIRRGTEVRLLGEERAVGGAVWLLVEVQELRGWVRADLLETAP